MKNGAIDKADFQKLVELADRERDRGTRIRTYKRILRPSGLRRLVVNLVGAKCMVHECQETERYRNTWGECGARVIVEVHHVEEVAKTNDHRPRNLCVLCANHHRLLHGLGMWNVEHIGPNVRLSRDTTQLIIERNPELFS
jgi:predicted HNH restriction endonuclease